MSESPASARRAPGYLLLTSVAALLTASCGSESILGDPAVNGVVDVPVATDIVDAVVIDAPRPDVPDVPVAVDVPDVPVAVDVPDVPITIDVPDVPVAIDVPDVPDVPAAIDVPVVMDVPSLMDVPDVSDVPVAVDVPDVPDVRDVPDVPDVRDVPDVPDVMIDAGPMGPGILGSAARFTILAGSTVSNTGLSIITGEVGVWPGLALVGIPGGTVVHAGDPVAAAAQADLTVAYNRLAAQPCGTVLTGRDLGGMVLAPGVYCFSSSAQLTGTVVLDGQNQPNPLFIFQVGSTLVTANVSAVLMINNARSCGVYWQTGSSATVGIGSNFAGNIVALASVTLTTGVTLLGRALARNGGVTMDTNVVTNAACPDPPWPTMSTGDAGVTDAGPSDRPDAATDAPTDGG
ncbi:MAG: ice-binding family protein [Deltaproteobacteria bacterium]|nr:ice-binding family protein [Myxococcales bacterium]MDP3213116.1 ice-binding family protein [Deltaproteobacteria bacterium]